MDAMIKYFLLISILGLTQGRPQSEEERELYEPNDRCPSYGHHLLPHEYDCTKFYYCEYGLKFIEPRDCANGTHFSYEDQVCVHPNDANCILSGPSTEDYVTYTTEGPYQETTRQTYDRPTQPTTIEPDSTTQISGTEPECEYLDNGCPADFDVHKLLPHETKCNKFYYCVFGEKVERTCGNGTYFNYDEQICDWPHNVDCASDPEDQTDPPVESTEEPETTTPGYPDGEILPNGCPADFDVHKLLPHETECNKFYYCVFGEKVERLCANGTYFNYEIQVCDWPRNVNCTSNEDINDPTDNVGGGNDNNVEDDDVVDWKPLPNGCPDNFDVHHLLPHETNCSRFYYCVFGEKVERECANGTHFNPVKQVCDWPRNAGCESVDSGNGCSGDAANDNSNGSNDNCNGGSGGGNDVGSGNDGNDDDDVLVWTPLPNGCPDNFHVHYLLPHETNCSLFYYCVFGEKVERECANGTHFNPVKQVCDWPRNAGCESVDSGNGCSGDASNDNDNSANNNCNGGSGGGNDVGGGNDGNDDDEVLEWTPLPNGCPDNFHVHYLLPHETNCSLFYYCVFGEKVERECANGTHFNPVKQVCDWPRNAGCESVDSGNGCSGGAANDNGNGGNDNCNGGSGGGNDVGGGNDGNDDNEDVLVWTPLPNGCPDNFHVHYLLPHETNCSLFYYCVFGEKVERECASGTHFSPLLQVCDWPWRAECESAEGEGNNNGGNDNGGNGGNDNGGNGGNDGSGNENGESDDHCDDDEGVEWTPLPNGCPSDFDVHHLLPHETNCSRFYYCVFGEKVERECANGTHFNPSLQVCDWPWRAECESVEGEGNDNGGNGGNDGSGNGNGGNDDDCDDGEGVEWTPLPNGCPSDFDVHHLLPHETNCSRFYYCVFGEKVERECANGTHFSPSLQVCDWPWRAECESVEGEGNDNGGNGGNDNGENGGNDNGGNGDNDGSGNGNGENDDDCDDDEGLEWTPLPNGCPSDFDVHHLLPHETNCSRFYYCVFGEKVERECANGTHFSPSLQVCDWPWRAECESVEGEGNDNGGNGGNDNGGNGGNDGSGNGNGENDDDDEGVEWTPLPNGCPSDFDVHHLLPHETNCSRFYYCVFGEKVERECANGTNFNPAKQVCDWPWSAGCESGDGSDTGGNGCDTGGDGGDAGGNCDETGGNGNDTGGDSSNDDSNICKDGCNVLPWAHESDCDKFWICAGEEPKLVLCSEGLHFNPTTFTCDFICNAGCVKEDVLATAEADGVKLFLP